MSKIFYIVKSRKIYRMFGSNFQSGSGLPGNNGNSNSWGSASGFGVSINTSKQGQMDQPNASSSLSLGNNMNSLKDPNLGNASSGGLFGNTSGITGSSKNTLNLFNKPSTNSVPMNQTERTPTLFGSSTTAQLNNTTSGLPSSGLLDRNTNQIGLFGNSMSKPTTDSNLFFGPYNNDKIFNNLTNSNSFMPSSVTELVYSSSEDKSKKDKLVGSNSNSILNVPRSRTSSLLSKLGKSLRFFSPNRSDVSTRESPEAIKGIFTQSNFVKGSSANFGSQKIAPGKVVKNSKTLGYANHGIKKLVIKSKPLKFHLIDADSVIGDRKKKVLTYSDVRSTATNQFVSDSDPGKHLSEQRNLDSTYETGKTLKESNAEPISSLDVETSKSFDVYWSSPSLKDLQASSMYDIHHVENFIIGRKGYGQISFNLPVDLSGIFKDALRSNVNVEEKLFGGIVIIDSKVVKVYHNDPSKPEMGRGINVPATITLEKIYPNSDTGTANFLKYLQKQRGMEFVTYEPLSGTWTFKVEHFSIWGLVEEEKSQTPVKIKESLQKQPNSFEEDFSSFVKDRSFKQEMKKQKLSSITRGIPGGWEYDSTVQQSPLNVKRRFVRDQINNEIRNSRKESIDNLADNTSEITIDSDEEARLEESIANSVFEIKSKPRKFALADNVSYLKSIVGLPTDVNMDDVVVEKAYEPRIDLSAFQRIETRANFAVSKDWLVQLELANDLNSALSSHFDDPQLDQPKISLQKVDDILFHDFNHRKTILEQEQVPEVTSTQKFLVDPAVKLSLECYKNAFLPILESSTIESRHNHYPLSNSKDLVLFQDILTYENTPNPDKSLLKLLSCLFDPIEILYPSLESDSISKPDKRVYLEEMKRKEYFGNWLKDYNFSLEKKVSKANSDDMLNLIFKNICCGDIHRAVQLCVESNNPSLACFLTLLDAKDMTTKSIASSQLKFWKERSMLNYIPLPIQQIFQILAGELEFAQDLEWNNVLTLNFFYGDAFDTLEEIFSAIRPQIKTKNLEMDVISIYCSIQTNDLETLKLTIESSTLPLRIKWYILRSISRRVSINYLFDDCSLKFGNLLRSYEYLSESAFVYSHISDDAIARDNIRDLIMKEVKGIVKNDDVSSETFYTGVLKVPTELLHEAISAKEHQEGCYWKEAKSLLNAGLWQKAHDCIAYYLAPELVISANEYEINSFSEIIALFPQQGKLVPEWSRAAGVYVSYFKIIMGTATDEVVLTLISHLLTSLPLLATHAKGPCCKYAVKLMSRKVGDLAIDNGFKIANLRDKILQLPLDAIDRHYFEMRFS